jgi:hypothetical protein
MCIKCNKYYVGETRNELKVRITQHVSNIRCKAKTPVSEHFNSENHDLKDLKFFALVHNPIWEDDKRRETESKWIIKLKSLQPHGLNIEANSHLPAFITLPFKGRNSLPSSLLPLLNKNITPTYTTGTPLRVTFSHKHNIARH